MKAAELCRQRRRFGFCLLDRGAKDGQTSHLTGLFGVRYACMARSGCESTVQRVSRCLPHRGAADGDPARYRGGGTGARGRVEAFAVGGTPVAQATAAVRPRADLVVPARGQVQRRKPEALL